jgi:anti-sigma regulatory factor (Ser/Thr protein kinase)
MTDVVDLTIPAAADLLVLARLTAATIAARADFGVDEIEDLRLAVEELCLPFVRSGGEGHLRLCYERDGESIEISCTAQLMRGDPVRRSGPDEEARQEDELSTRILDALVDEHGADTSGGTPRVWIVVRRTPRG